MTTVASNITALPNELLEKIFDYIPLCSDKVQLRLLCKTWYNIIGGVTHFAYYEDSTEQFCDFLQNYPHLQNNVKSLRVKGNNDRDFSGLFMEAILPLCPNLVELILSMDLISNSDYVKRLYMLCASKRRTVTLPKLQKFDVWSMKNDAEWFYVEILRILRDSLTSLNLTVNRSIFAAANIEKSVERFLALFPCLKYLRLEYLPFAQEPITSRSVGDFSKLFKNHTRRLDTIKVFGSVYYPCTAENLEAMLGARAMNDSSVKFLELDIDSMDILCLKYISTRLNKIERLRIFTKEQVMVNTSTTSSQEVEAIIQDLDTYCKGISGEVCMNFRCQDRQGVVRISHV